MLSLTLQFRLYVVLHVVLQLALLVLLGFFLFFYNLESAENRHANITDY